MKAYSIFDDFTVEAAEILNNAGVDLTIHPYGIPRPDAKQMKEILESYDCVIIGTTQEITEDMFENITGPKIIATASVGLDHIHIPTDKKEEILIINTPKANAQSVAEYTLGCALACCKRLEEGKLLYLQGENNKKLYKKPEDLAGKTLGIVGAGNISVKIMEYALFFGMNILCWTKHPEQHSELCEKGVVFTGLKELAESADVISVNLPNKVETQNIISADFVDAMKKNCIFISVSRLETIDIEALLKKAKETLGFYVCADIDVNEKVYKSLPDIPNVKITPHIAGGTIETRKRMFSELAERIRLIKLA